MLGFLTANIGTIVVAAVLAVIMFFAVRSVIKGKKKGRCSCGGNCGSCAMGSVCHKK